LGRWRCGSTVTTGRRSALLGLLWLLFTLYHWFGDAISESEGGHYGKNVDKSYRWSMSWFIFSEVMFFGAFFGALFYARESRCTSSAASTTS
jgi:cytochrome c oxidase subunit 3